MAKYLSVLFGLLFSFVSFAGELHTDVFGDIYDGDSPFRVGHVDAHTAGRLWSDVFGDIYVEGSPFKVSHIDDIHTEGVLYMDAFKDVYVTGSPFRVDAKEAKEALNLED